MSKPLDGKTAIVTGASRGIGFAIARRLAGDGAKVVLTSRETESAEAAAREIGENAVGFGAHAAEEDAAEACAEFAVDRFGSLDILVNNAGTNPAAGPSTEVDRPRFSKTIDVNLWAPLLWTAVSERAWMGEHGGSVVNIASINGFTTGSGTGIYRVTKAGMLHLTRQLAFELSPGIRVNAIAPGLVRTRLSEALWGPDEAAAVESIPLGRIGEPDDIAGGVAFLVGEDGSWMTGQTIVMDGGQVINNSASSTSPRLRENRD